MIEEILIKYLSNVLDIPVYAESPSKIIDEFIVIEKTSGGNQNHIKSATLAIQSNAKTLLNAAKINENVKIAMVQMAFEVSEICKVKLNTDYNFTNTAKKQYRYQAVFDIFYY